MPSAKAVEIDEHEAPPPLPLEPPPDSDDEDTPVNQPINSLGEDDDEDEDEDEEGNDEDAERAGDEDQGEGPASAAAAAEDAADEPSKQQKGKSKGKGKAKQDAAGDKQQPWQAVWSPESNGEREYTPRMHLLDSCSAWYFWNTITGEVSWTNPLEPEGSSSTPAQPPLPPGPPPEGSAPSAAFGLPRDIDPDLAFLLPPSQRGGPGADASAQTALFNSRTGRFTPADYNYTVDHLDEYNRSKRMNSHYFDVEAWEKQRAAENAKRKADEAAGIAPKKITKKDMVSCPYDWLRHC